MAALTTHVGSVPSSDPRAAAQAASIGATIGGDGWWYKNGKRLTPADADALVNAAGTGVQSTDTAHGHQGGTIGGAVGSLWEHNKKPIAIGAGTLAGTMVGAPYLGGLLGTGMGATVGGMAGGALGNAATGGGDPGAGGALAGAIGGGLGVYANTHGYNPLNRPTPVTSIAPGTDLSQVGNASNPTGGAGLSWGANGLVHGPGSTTPGASGGTNGQPGATSGGIPSSVASLLGNVPGIGELLSSGANFLGGNGGLNALAVAQGLNAAQLGQQSSDYAKQAGNSAVGAWDAKAPLRVAGIAGMLKPPVADTSSLGQIAARGNPFANKPTPVGSL